MSEDVEARMGYKAIDTLKNMIMEYMKEHINKEGKYIGDEFYSLFYGKCLEYLSEK